MIVRLTRRGVDVPIIVQEWCPALKSLSKTISRLGGTADVRRLWSLLLDCLVGFARIGMWPKDRNYLGNFSLRDDRVVLVDAGEVRREPPPGSHMSPPKNDGKILHFARALGDEEAGPLLVDMARKNLEPKAVGRLWGTSKGSPCDPPPSSLRDGMEILGISSALDVTDGANVISLRAISPGRQVSLFLDHGSIIKIEKRLMTP